MNEGKVELVAWSRSHKWHPRILKWTFSGLGLGFAWNQSFVGCLSFGIGKFLYKFVEAVWFSKESRSHEMCIACNNEVIPNS
jgi:hypothetical protein